MWTRQTRESKEEQDAVAGQQREPRAEVGDQVATAIQRMTDILACLVQQQGQTPINQPNGPEIGEDRALKHFQKFARPKFLEGPDLETAEHWLEAMVNIFTTLDYMEERQVAFSVFQFEGPART